MSLVKIQLGSGSNQLPDFKNYDMDLDFSKLPLPFADNSVDFIFGEHTFEHITPQQFFLLLEDIKRVLRPNGVVRICMPVLDRLKYDHARDIILNHGHQGAYTTDLIRRFLLIAGFQPVQIRITTRDPIDGHHRVIGIAKDDLETCRIEARK
jgi:predicted SAM-dependent methyltransferase